ncbi:hypothetical protein BKA70DRAFT_1406676 [Coprinopsis sp. MPI-PUGE-AT-0042]|nr:hypothetical protein BKA70DRAFT_1406676 [Coprinopsis sp. MPI-PUGE-AT-0042]
MPDTKSFSQFLQDARDGDISHLRAVITAITPQNYSIRALDLPLNLLQSRPKQPKLVPASLEELRRGILILECLREMLVASTKANILKEQTTERLLPCLEDIYLWLSFLVDHFERLSPGEDVHRIAGSFAWTVCVVMDYDPRLFKSFASSVQGVKLSLKLLTKRREDYGDQTYFCPHLIYGELMTVVLARLVMEEDGQATVGDIILNSKRALLSFTHAFCSRIRQISSYRNADLDFTRDAVYMRRRVLMPMWEIQTILVVRNTAFHSALRKAGCLMAWVEAFNHLHRLEGDRYILEDIRALISLAMSHGQNSVRGMEILLDEGLLSMLLPAMLKTNINQTSRKDVCEAILIRVGAYGHHPRIIRALKRALDRAPPKEIDAAKSLPHIGRRWDDIAYAVGIRAPKLALLKRHGKMLTLVCDNNRESHPLTFIEPKACSKCHSVVYCAQGCQEEDWKERHWRECAIMARSRRERQAYGFHFGLESRLFHMMNGRQSFSQGFRYLEQQRLQLGQPVNEFIINIDRFTGKPREENLGVMPMTYHFASRIEGDCPAAEARAFSMIKSFQSTLDLRLRLLEVQVVWNHAVRVSLLLELMKNGDDWTFGQSVVRVQKPQLDEEQFSKDRFMISDFERGTSLLTCGSKERSRFALNLKRHPLRYPREAVVDIGMNCVGNCLYDQPSLTMEDIPPELIARFIRDSLVFPLDVGGLQSFRTLRAVCSRWRSISFSTRTFWSALSVNLRHPSNDAQFAEHARQWFSRSGPTAPLRLVVEDVGLLHDTRLYDANRIALVQLIHELRDRWEHLTIAIRTNTLESMTLHPIASPHFPTGVLWTKITTLDLFQRPCPKYLPPPVDLCFLTRIPNLQKLSLRLPQSPLSVPVCHQVRSLEVCTPEPFELDLPTLFPALQELYIEPLLWDFSIPQGEMAFPNVKVLTVETIESTVFDVLEKLVCPSLRELGLRFGQRRTTDLLDGSSLVKVIADFTWRSNLTEGLKSLSILRSPAAPGADSAIAALLESLPTLRHIDVRRWPFRCNVPPGLLPCLSSLVIRDLRPGSVHEPCWEASQNSLFSFIESRGQRMHDGINRRERVAKLNNIVLHQGRGNFPLAQTERLVDLGMNVTIRPDDALACFK